MKTSPVAVKNTMKKRHEEEGVSIRRQHVFEQEKVRPGKYFR